MALKEVRMLPKSPAEALDSRHRLTRARRRQARHDAQARVPAVRRVLRGGDTDALDWRSDARLLAILARAAQREQEDREKDLIPIP
jgi:hypothetical protein